MRLTPRFLLSAAAPFAALPGRAVAEGMPQLHFGDPLLQGQVVWGAIIFFIFYLILSRSALPRVGKVLEKRDKRIQQDLTLARQSKAQADRAHQELLSAKEKASESARAEIQNIRATAKAEAQALTEQTTSRLESEIRDAEARIMEARTNAFSHLTDIASSTTASLTERFLGQYDSDAIAKAVQRARH